MIAIDTNVLLRYLLRDDEAHAERARCIVALLSRLRKGGREGLVLVVRDAYRDVSCCRDFTTTRGASRSREATWLVWVF